MAAMRTKNAGSSGWATIIVEIVGGLPVFIGALVPLATLPVLFVLLVASRSTPPGRISGNLVMRPNRTDRLKLWRCRCLVGRCYGAADPGPTSVQIFRLFSIEFADLVQPKLATGIRPIALSNVAATSKL
jgi:hypothetical protein